ncbi:acyl-ACP thioesterase domain-containing protein [Rapidithrix thailandica]|uniref:Acyl-ACP thioesterase domain-containing protein n=1 Tax=Rapidithrix thailandica TaxID=413964 RepID=A0AAW9SD87_9BACT
MENTGIYSYLVQPYQVDFQQKINFTTLGNYLIQSAGIHAEERGFGLQQLLENKKAWFLTRLAIDIEQYPLQFEKIWIETWVSEVGDRFTTRNFNILNRNKEVIGGASSSWAMIDLTTRRPASLSNLIGNDYVDGNLACRVMQPEKVPSVSKDLAPTEQLTVKYSDLDTNSHVNSMRYMQWMLDLFPLELYQERHIGRFEINYAAETHYSDNVALYKEEVQPSEEFIIELKKEPAKTVCRGKVTFR